MIHTLSVRTNRRTELVDLTGQIQERVRLSGVEEGVCHIFAAHTTAGLTINENADPSVAGRHPHGPEPDHQRPGGLCPP